MGFFLVFNQKKMSKEKTWLGVMDVWVGRLFVASQYHRLLMTNGTTIKKHFAKKDGNP